MGVCFCLEIWRKKKVCNYWKAPKGYVILTPKLAILNVLRSLFSQKGSCNIVFVGLYDFLNLVSHPN